ncbi:MAG TPA: hypothetical protein VD905_14235, partial [Flavobacteriales bacterium]|nr:hypothetical protein [Flavobacteriales bacterium]
TKGLIQSDVTMAAIRPKVAYYAVQNIASIFDSDLLLNPGFKYNSSHKNSMSVYGFQHAKTGTPLVALWIDSTTATNSFQTTAVDLLIDNSRFKAPVLVDLMTGNIYEIPKKQWTSLEGATRFTNLPIYDAPMLIAERSMLKMKRVK